MRLASLALLPFVAACLISFARCDDDLEQQLAAVAESSSYTVQFGSFISEQDLPAGEALQVAYFSSRLCGRGFLNASGQVNRSLLQDVTELTNFNTSSYYFFDITKATAAVPAPVTHALGTGTSCNAVCDSACTIFLMF